MAADGEKHYHLDSCQQQYARYVLDVSLEFKTRNPAMTRAGEFIVTWGSRPQPNKDVSTLLVNSENPQILVNQPKTLSLIVQLAPIMSHRFRILSRDFTPEDRWKDVGFVDLDLAKYLPKVAHLRMFKLMGEIPTRPSPEPDFAASVLLTLECGFLFNETPVLHFSSSYLAMFDKVRTNPKPLQPQIKHHKQTIFDLAVLTPDQAQHMAQHEQKIRNLTLLEVDVLKNQARYLRDHRNVYQEVLDSGRKRNGPSLITKLSDDDDDHDYVIVDKPSSTDLAHADLLDTFPKLAAPIVLYRKLRRPFR
jgi:hypothetical protein